MTTMVPTRRGAAPRTTQPTPARAFPHQQLDQNAPTDLQDRLFARARRLPGVQVGRSLVSLPESRAFHLDPEVAVGPPRSYQRATEFAHIHPAHDGSLHLTLPPDLYTAVLEAGWGEPHPISGTMMLFGPRDDDELEVVWPAGLAPLRHHPGVDRRPGLRGNDHGARPAARRARPRRVGQHVPRDHGTVAAGPAAARRGGPGRSAWC